MVYFSKETWTILEQRSKYYSLKLMYWNMLKLLHIILPGVVWKLVQVLKLSLKKAEIGKEKRVFFSLVKQLTVARSHIEVPFNA